MSDDECGSALVPVTLASLVAIASASSSHPMSRGEQEYVNHLATMLAENPARVRLYTVAFDSTDDAALDAATTRPEDDPMSLDDIVSACTKYRVRARVADGAELLGEFVPVNERRVPQSRVSNPVVGSSPEA